MGRFNLEPVKRPEKQSQRHRLCLCAMSRRDWFWGQQGWKLFDDFAGPSLVVMNVTCFCLMALRVAPGSSSWALFFSCPKHSVRHLVACHKPLFASTFSSGFYSLQLNPDEYRCVWDCQESKAEDTVSELQQCRGLSVGHWQQRRLLTSGLLCPRVCGKDGARYAASGPKN